MLAQRPSKTLPNVELQVLWFPRGCEAKFPVQAGPPLDPQPLHRGWPSTSPSYSCTSGRNETEKGPDVPRMPPRALAVGPRVASFVPAGDAGPGIHSFLKNLLTGQKEPFFPGLPRLLPRPVVQVSHAVPFPSLLSHLVCGSAEAWPLLPSLAPPQPPLASVPGHRISEANLNPL